MVATLIDEVKASRAATATQTAVIVQSNMQVVAALSPFTTASKGDVVEKGLEERPHAAGTALKEWMSRGGHFDADTLGDLGFRR